MSLYTKIIDLQKLTTAWQKVRKNKPAAGADHITCEQFEANQREELKQLNLDLKEHKYLPVPVKKIILYKGEKAREIALYSMRDKVVQQSVASELSKLYDPYFVQGTFAYRSGKSALQAIDLVAEQMQSGKWNVLLKLDITKFFDRIQWPILQSIIQKRIREDDVIQLIQKDVQNVSLEDSGELKDKSLGIYQGSGISPVLSNIYLMEFDRWLSEKDIFYIRYSDDMLLLGKNRDSMLILLKKIKMKLQCYGLEINENKQILADINTGVNFLGYHISEKGKAIPARAEQSLEDKLETIWLTSETELEEKIKKAAEIIGGWEQYFKEERQHISIFEYVTLVRLSENEEDKLQKLMEFRPKIDNIYKDIAEYLSDFWKRKEQPSLELLEYEQFYRIYHLSEHAQISDSIRDELLLSYRQLVIHEDEKILIELMQLYTDGQQYEKAAFWMEKKEKQKVLRHTVLIPPGSSIPEDQILWDKATLHRMLKTLVGREDIYAQEIIDGGNHRKNELQILPLTEKIVEQHLSGKYTIATYIQRSNSTVKFMVIDIDVSKKVLMKYGNDTSEFRSYLTKTGETARQVLKILHSFGMQGYVEFSGYRGYHVWVFFTEWLPVRYSNMLSDLIEAKLSSSEEDGICIEYFPNKTRLKPGKYGQAIKLPYGIHSKTGERSYFIDEDGIKVENLNLFLDSLAKNSLSTIKKVLAANTGYKEKQPGQKVDENLDAFPDISENVREVLNKCNLMRYLCQKAAKTGYLTHFERLSILYVFAHLGEDGRQFIHTVMANTLNYQYNITDRFINKCPEKPISCIKLREQYKKITAEYGCSCTFKRTKNCYPSPVMHAISRSNDLQDDITLPISRSITQEKKKKVIDEINIHKKALELARKILDYKKQKRSLDNNIQKIEKELSAIFDDANTDCLEIELGMLVRRKKEDSYEWLIDL
mgnify:FL=1